MLLKDAGCSSNAGKVAALFGVDDAIVKSSRRAARHALDRGAFEALEQILPGLSSETREPWHAVQRGPE